MTRLTSQISRFLLATLAGFAWSLVYPCIGTEGDFVWLAFTAIFFILFQLSRSKVRAISVMVATVSAISGLAALTWSGIIWRFGFAYPNIPHVLHWLFSTDGESSYNAYDGELFLALFILFLAITLSVPRLRQIFIREAA